MKYLYALIISLFVTCSLWAQEIERSTEKVRVNGKVYYTHTVKKKENLLLLSKAYNVTPNEILKHNQPAATGLKVGMLLYIPINDASADAANGTGVSGANAVGTKKLTPEQQAAHNALKEKKYKKHTVRWFENLEEIAQKYSVPADGIILLNELKDNKPKSRQVLLIPDNEYLAAMGLSSDGAASDSSNNSAFAGSSSDLADELDMEDDTTGNELNELSGQIPGMPDGVRKRAWNETIEIAYILPLNSKDTNNVNSNFMDFYAGALLAINDSKDAGAKIKVNVYDQDSYSPLHKLIDKPGFERNQLIIGPVRTQQLENFTGYAIEKKIPLVSPLDNTSEKFADVNEYFVQMPANASAQISNTLDLLEKVRGRDSISKVLLIYEKGNLSDSLYVNSAKSILESKGIAYTPVSYGILEGRTIYSKMLSLVDTLSVTPHIALVPSNSEAFVSDVIRNLDLCTKSGAQITLFGLPKWRNFETINADLYHKMRLHISLPYFVDYNNSVVKKFLLQYRALYNTEPTPFAYQGYDVTRYFLDLMQQYGNTFIYADTLKRGAMLQSDFQLYRAEKGLKNKATRNIVYKPNLSIEVVY